MNISQRLRTCAKRTGLDAVIELLQEAADEIDALQARAQATQATPSIPSDGPSTYAQRFTAAVSVICGVTPPAALVCDWINKAERHDDLQQWVGSYAPGWVQNIAVLDAAHQMADQPTDGGNHEPAQQPDNAACRSVQKRLAAQQPATAIACGIPGMAKTTCPYCGQGFAFEHEQPATPEPVQADSSEHLRVIASLGAALRRLSFAAQTTGGTDGPDAELQSAIGQAEQALSLGGIWQAMSATPEPVWCVATGERVNGEETFTHHDAYVPLADCFPLYTHPAPSVPDVDFELQELREIERAMDDFADCGETDVVDTLLLRAVQAGFLECTHFHVANRGALQEAIDAAMLAAKDASA